MRTGQASATTAIAFLLLAATPALLACGKPDDAQKHVVPVASAPPAPATTTAPVAPAPSPSPSASTPVRPVGPAVELRLACVANTMAYDKTRLTVPTGSTVHLTLQNGANAVGAPHNWVLVKPGTEASVASAGLKFGEAASYVDARDTNVLAHTSMAKPGETTEVTFIAPAPGDYPYICTFPGHYLMMKGLLTVTP